MAWLSSLLSTAAPAAEAAGAAGTAAGIGAGAATLGGTGVIGGAIPSVAGGTSLASSLGTLPALSTASPMLQTAGALGRGALDQLGQAGMQQLTQSPGAPPDQLSQAQPLTPIAALQQQGQGQQQQPGEWYVNPQTNRLSRRFLPTIL